MPAKAGIQGLQLSALWIPAFAGMTQVACRNSPTLDLNKSVNDSGTDTDFDTPPNIQTKAHLYNNSITRI